jgi:hypothetical protein
VFGQCGWSWIPTPVAGCFGDVLGQQSWYVFYLRVFGEVDKFGLDEVRQAARSIFESRLAQMSEVDVVQCVAFWREHCTFFF